MAQKFDICPFCGHKVEILDEEEKQGWEDLPGFRPDSFHFCCSDSECLIGTTSDFWETNWENEEEAAAAWNKRAAVKDER